MDHIPVCIRGSASAPTIVCVLGWGGCTRRQLRRVLDFYSSHDFTTVSWINPMLNYVCGIDMKQIEHLLDIFLHENRTSNNIIIHLHSNNGALAWGYMLNLMKTNERYSQLLTYIKGIILDSAPYIHFNNSPDWIIRSAFVASRSFVSIILNRAQYFHLVYTPLSIYYFSIQYFYGRYLSSDPSSSEDKIKKLLDTTPIDIKQCYLYSDADRVFSSYVIEQFMARQVERGVHVTSHRFCSSEHVNHFRLFPKEYGKIILDFIGHTQEHNLSDKSK